MAEKTHEAEAPRPRSPSGPARLYVERTIKDDEGERTESKEDLIEVARFLTEPAIVHYKKGMTVNLGNYESARVEVGLSLPVYPEEVAAACEKVSRMVDALLTRETEEIIAAKDDEGSG